MVVRACHPRLAWPDTAWYASQLPSPTASPIDCTPLCSRRCVTGWAWRLSRRAHLREAGGSLLRQCGARRLGLYVLGRGELSREFDMTNLSNDWLAKCYPRHQYEALFVRLPVCKFDCLFSRFVDISILITRCLFGFPVQSVIASSPASHFQGPSSRSLRAKNASFDPTPQKLVGS